MDQEGVWIFGLEQPKDRRRIALCMQAFGWESSDIREKMGSPENVQY